MHSSEDRSFLYMQIDRHATRGPHRSLHQKVHMTPPALLMTFTITVVVESFRAAGDATCKGFFASVGLLMT